MCVWHFGMFSCRHPTMQFHTPDLDDRRCDLSLTKNCPAWRAAPFADSHLRCASCEEEVGARIRYYYRQIRDSGVYGVGQPGYGYGGMSGLWTMLVIESQTAQGMSQYPDILEENHGQGYDKSNVREKVEPKVEDEKHEAGQQG